jgi:hypothetical protein
MQTLKKIRTIAIILFLSLLVHAQDGKITFSKHISPIIFKNCAPCHSPGQIGPFNLVNYQDVKRKAKTIKKVISSRYMPPYLADVHYSKLANPQVLSDKQIAMINKWIDGGMEQGDTKPLGYKSEFVSNNKKPDLVLQVERIAIKGDDKEKFYYVKVPFQLTNEEQICLCEFIPGNRKVVHHMDAFLYNFKPGSNVFIGPRVAGEELYSDDKSVLKYFMMTNIDGSTPKKIAASIIDFFPGMQQPRYPEGIRKTFPMAKSGVILLSKIHYGGSTVDTFDQSRINIYFCKKKPEREVMSYMVGSPDHKIIPALFIPANKVKTFMTYQELTMDISLLSVQPHAHWLGRSFIVYAKTKDKKTIPLLKINNWDMRWQRVYKLKNMVRIPAGSTIYFEGTYDNTTNNPVNPFNPPRDIPESIRTKDEMLQLWFDFLPYKPGDEKISLE